MQKIPLRKGEGPYEILSSHPDPETNGIKETETLFNVRAYGETQQSRPSVFILSESSHNEGSDIAIVAPQIGAKLCQEFGYEGFDPKATFIVHYPENVKGNNPERFVKADFEYSGDSPRWSSDQVELSQENVAQMIGHENMEVGYDASPSQNQNPLVQRAFESGLDPSLKNEPSIDFD